MSWSPLQREMLDAMGLSPYRLASAAPAAQPAPDGPHAALRDPAATHPPAVDARDRHAPRDPVDALAAALLRAAGRGHDAADRDDVLRACPAPQALRGDPRAKRALWPVLRTMRRH